MKKKLILLLILLSFAVPQPLSAAESEDRYLNMRQDQIRVKQNRADDLTYRIDAMQENLRQERTQIKQAGERLWQDYVQSIEVEKKELNDRMKNIEERQRLFAEELAKKQKQDELRVREKEMELKRLMLDLERTRAEISEDQRVLSDMKQGITEEQKERGGQSEKREVLDGEVLGNRSIKIAGFKGREIMGEEPLARKPIREEYYVGDDDTLDISVWRVPDLSRQVTVRPDGRISLPLAGDIDVIGKSLVEVRTIITEKLREFVKNPQVTISITKFGGRKFIMLGEIKSPGVYRFQQEISLIEAIALAGGFSEKARSGKVMVIRGDIHKEPQVRKMINANVSNILKHGILSENLTIQANDIIYVGRDFLGDYDDVMDQVVRPAIDDILNFFVVRSAIRTAQEKGV